MANTPAELGVVGMCVGRLDAPGRRIRRQGDATPSEQHSRLKGGLL